MSDINLGIFRHGINDKEITPFIELTIPKTAKSNSRNQRGCSWNIYYIYVKFS